MALYLGVDGGQSSTTALIADETGRILGRGVGGPCNHVGKAEGRARFQSAMEQCLQEAAAHASLDARALRFEVVCMGFSGGPEDKEPYLRETVHAANYVLTTDAWVALTGATGGEPGVMTISGTGSIALGRNAAGRTQRVGGWGFVFGDEGSGFDITRQAIRAALRQEEGWGPPTALHAKLLEACEAPDANTLMHWFYTDAWPRSRVAALSRLVDEVAREGDPSALEILRNAAQQLATMAAVVRDSLFGNNEPAVISYVGGVFQSEILLSRYRMLVELEDGNRFADPVYGPAEGALIEALRAGGAPDKLVF
ncbi:MAG: BadF/BadG/BcrA/BcrD ATPase family protein [Bryobacterales bacterium]|nr:BadF/BadG/BcrA/BcrD ATPase family protein [Bryobacterales bacterium]